MEGRLGRVENEKTGEAGVSKVVWDDEIHPTGELYFVACCTAPLLSQQHASERSPKTINTHPIISLSLTIFVVVVVVA